MEIEKISFFNRLEYDMESNETELETINLENSNLEDFNKSYLKFFTDKNNRKKGYEIVDVTDIIFKESIIIGKKTYKFDEDIKNKKINMNDVTKKSKNGEDNILVNKPFEKKSNKKYFFEPADKNIFDYYLNYYNNNNNNHFIIDIKNFEEINDIQKISKKLTKFGQINKENYKNINHNKLNNGSEDQSNNSFNNNNDSNNNMNNNNNRNNDNNNNNNNDNNNNDNNNNDSNNNNDNNDNNDNNYNNNNDNNDNNNNDNNDSDSNNNFNNNNNNYDSNNEDNTSSNSNNNLNINNNVIDKNDNNISSLSSNNIFRIYSIEEIRDQKNLQRKKLRHKKKRKFKPDDIRKKIKARFHKNLKEILNENLKICGSKKFFDFLPQGFVSNISIEKNKEAFKLTYLEMLKNNFENCTNNQKQKLIDKKKVNNNKETLLYLEKNPEISEKSGFDLIKNETYENLLSEYFQSKQFEDTIKDLENENEEEDYICEYVNKSKNYVNFFKTSSFNNFNNSYKNIELKEEFNKNIIDVDNNYEI